MQNVDEKLQFFNKKLIKKLKPSPCLSQILMMQLCDKASRRFKQSKYNAHWNYYKDLRDFTRLAIKHKKMNKADLKQNFLELNNLNNYSKETIEVPDLPAGADIIIKQVISSSKTNDKPCNH